MKTKTTSKMQRKYLKRGWGNLEEGEERGQTVRGKKAGKSRQLRVLLRHFKLKVTIKPSLG